MVNPYGVVGQNPVFTGGNMYGTQSPYGLYGQNPWMMLAESPYARLTGQTTVFSPQAIPNLSSFQQSSFIDMNAFLGNKTGIPAYPSFVGATAMQQSQNPLFQTYQQYQQTQQPMYQQPMYQQPMYQQPMYQQPMYQQPMYGGYAQQKDPFTTMMDGLADALLGVFIGGRR